MIFRSATNAACRLPNSTPRKLLAHASRQAKERDFGKFPIIDVDSHHYENESMSEILDYMDDPVLRHLALSARQANAKGNGMMPTGVGYQDMGGRVTRYPLRHMEKAEGDKHRDVTLTKRWMDAMGVDVAVMFPSPMLQLGVHPQVEVEVALARAYNRWLTERVLAHEPRIRSMLYLPFNDPDASFRMVQEMGRKTGRGRLHGDGGALPAGAAQFLHEDVCAAGGDESAARFPRRL